MRPTIRPEIIPMFLPVIHNRRGCQQLGVGLSRFLPGEVDHFQFAVIGMPISPISMVVVTLMTPAPDAEIQAMIDETRNSSGETVIYQLH